MVAKRVAKRKELIRQNSYCVGCLKKLTKTSGSHSVKNGFMCDKCYAEKPEAVEV